MVRITYSIALIQIHMIHFSNCFVNLSKALLHIVLFVFMISLYMSGSYRLCYRCYCECHDTLERLLEAGGAGLLNYTCFFIFYYEPMAIEQQH